ncbi:formimidoylglutamate deiminase [Fontisubflavum oceani]|uniref:formimidoylglutamate deiminase n=1 Tax=Fontisubflavum oceani TaxID=2978973 RepID=UPI0025B5C91E|nr:formimidoylglutamate deiminase [Fontisubflavum oceani]WJY20337.1 formimidoylglutamate deiminase [Fontisubflavum oceani]
MRRIWAEQALLPEGWAENVAVEISADGRIATVMTGADPGGQRLTTLLPAPANLHSHAFQRAMAGMTERRGVQSGDSFWTWRQLMFRFLDQVTPDHVEAIAAFVQMEMLEAGYATNVEFHYLHHQPGGAAYANIAEMSERIAAAAGQSGIGLTLLPVQYQFGGCDGRPLGPGQVRFGTTPDTYTKLLDHAGRALHALPADTALGVAPHSLRAVAPGTLADIAGLTEGPVHMHLAEQIAEVAEVQAHLGTRPVEWLIGNVAVDPRWCLIHCTQMRPHETEALAKTGAVAGLCPITEASLGDGIFDGVRWQAAGGAFGIGSDSNIRISLSEELRSLEYSQRLRDQSRATLATPKRSTGRVLFDAVTQGGAQAAGRASGAIQPGLWADLMALDGTAVDLDGRRGDDTLDTYIFAGDDRMVTDVWAAGRHLVQSGRHIGHDRITAAYRAAMIDLRGRI